MPRIRTIKPEFPQSESMGRVSRDARLAFIEMWTVADDSGRLRGNSRMLASILFPYDDDAPKLIDGWLDELEREQCILRYEADGQKYIQIVNFNTHQKIEKPSPSKLPSFDDDSVNTPRNLPEASRKMSLDQGRDQGEDQGEERILEDAPAAPSPAKADPLFHKIRESFERIYGNLPDYPREGKAINRIIKLASGDESIVQRMIEAFYRLTKSSDKYWSSQPFLPSVLSAGGIWPRVKLEASKGEVDLSWVDELEQPKQVEVVR